MKKTRSTLWSINAGTFLGIPVRIHMTFFIFLLWITFDDHAGGGEPLHELLFVIAIFLCVLVHELAHALVARKFGIKTKDVMLFPFGGIATIVGRPKPDAEFLISIAGPLVNIILALILLPFLSLMDILDGGSFLGRIFIANVFIAVFNLIPALPMDGGRILRAGLALLNFSNATFIAARIGQALALVMGVVALFFGRIDLLLISILVFLGAVQEYVQARAKEVVTGFTVRDVMIEAKYLLTFSHGTTISTALSTALRSFQHIFPVIYAEEVLGIVDREMLMEAISGGEPEGYVSAVMVRDFPKVAPSEPLAKGLEIAEASDGSPVFVIEEGRFLGLLIPEKAFEYLLIQGARERIEQFKPQDELPF